MKFNIALLIFATAFVLGCADDDSSGIPESGSLLAPELTPDMSAELPIDRYPSDDELAALDGLPDLEQAKALFYGTWQEIDPATQCVTTYQHGLNGVYTASGLDWRGTGIYTLTSSRFGIEMDVLLEIDNLLSDCYGVLDKRSLELNDGSPFLFLVKFPDQNTVEFRRGVSSPPRFTIKRL